MRTIEANVDLIAACGLYCGSCKRFLAEKCPGCRGNEKASWCKVRSCVQSRGLTNCAGCQDHPDPRTCRTVNNLPARVLSLVLNSDRFACLEKIRTEGNEAFAATMAERKAQTLPRW